MLTNALVSLHLQLMKAGSSLYFIFSLGALCSSDVCRRESGSCCTVSFFLKFHHFLVFVFFFCVILIHRFKASFCLCLSEQLHYNEIYAKFAYIFNLSTSKLFCVTVLQLLLSDSFKTNLDLYPFD